MKIEALLKKPLWLYGLVSALSVLVMALVSTLWSPQLHQWEERLASRTWSLASPDATERRVVVVDIDEKSTQSLGPWPWPRERVATLLTALDAYNVNLKVVDVLFAIKQHVHHLEVDTVGIQAIEQLGHAVARPRPCA